MRLSLGDEPVATSITLEALDSNISVGTSRTRRDMMRSDHGYFLRDKYSNCLDHAQSSDNVHDSTDIEKSTQWT